MSRFLKFLAGLLLIPVCMAVTHAALRLVTSLHPLNAAFIPPAAWALAGGLGVWLVVYFTLPDPVRTYVLAHELTHALWGLVMGAKVSNLRVSQSGGSVTLSRNNFLITLAPYFFPLYTVLVIGAYYLLSLFVPVQRWHLIWLGLVGFTWGFHFTFTVSTLMRQQSDIRECGRLFSYAIIYLMNVLGIGLWVVAVSSASLRDLAEALRAGWFFTVAVLLEAYTTIRNGLAALGNKPPARAL